MELARRLSEKTIVRYLFVGGTSFAIELTSLFIMKDVLHFDTALAVSVAYWIGLLLAFGLQKVIAFRDKRTELRILTWQAFLFGLLTLFNWGFTVLFVGLFPDEYWIYTRILAQAIFASWNFVLYKYVIFNDARKAN